MDKLIYQKLLIELNVKKNKKGNNMKKVYVAGAMSSNNILGVLRNISAGVHYGAEVLARGFAPFVPHFDIAFMLQKGWDGFDVPLQTYYDYTMAWLEASDIVLVCPNWEKSIGTINEIKRAEELGKPVYYSLEDLLEHESKVSEVV